MLKPVISYSQNREDLFLYALLGHRKKGFYVDVGAHHPKHHSVTKLFYDRGWSGINIEANPKLFRQFPRARKRDINLNVGAAAKDSSLVFRQYPNHPGLSTFSEKIKKLHEEESIPFVDVTIPTRTLETILTEHKAKQIDFMSIDVEGYEIEVLSGNDWQRFRPNVLVLEATVRGKLNPFLRALDYKLEFFDGLNNYYLDRTAEESLTIYQYAPTVLSTGFYTTFEKQLEDQLSALTADLEQKKNDYDLLIDELAEMKRIKNQLRALARASRTFVKGRVKKG